MKSSQIVLSGVVLAAMTVLLQVGWSVAEQEPLASAASTKARIHRSIRGKSLLAQIVPTKRKRPATLPARRVSPTHQSALLPIVDQPTFTNEHKVLANTLLRQLPESCREKLTTFIIRYDHPEQRGLAGKSTVILTGNVERNEFVGLFVHEVFGHFYDLGCLQGSEQSGASAFVDGQDIMWNDDPSVAFYAICFATATVQNGTCTAEDFVTGYASSDAFESLAETMAYYYLQPEDFRTRAASNDIIARQLAWMERYAPTHATLATGSERTNGSPVPWDATRTAFALAPAFGKLMGE